MNPLRQARHDAENLQAALVIAADPALYPEHSLAAQWSERVRRRLIVQPRLADAYEVACQCGVIEIPAAAVESNHGRTRCPRCGAGVTIEWRSA